MKKIFFDEENLITVDGTDNTEDLEIFPETKKIYISSSGKDIPASSDLTYQYRISVDPVEVYVRVLESSDNGEFTNFIDQYSIKDGVVLGSELIRRNKDSLGKNYFEGGTLELIANLEKAVEWHKLPMSGSSHLVFFILSKHPEIISEEEYRKFLRQTDERIRNGLLKVENFLKKDSAGLQVFIRNSDLKNIWYSGKNEFSEKEHGEAVSYLENKIHKPLFSADSKEYSGISEYEFNSSSEILNDIDLFLNKKEAVTVKKNEDVVSSTVAYGYFATGLTVLFVTLKLTNNIDWSWLAVFSPYLILKGVTLLFYFVRGSNK